jgi:hypothetical protein
MKEQIIEFETAELAKEKKFNLASLNFYVKPNCKMFGLDEHGRPYLIQKSTKNNIYIVGEHVALNMKNVLYAPTQDLLQKWFREKHGLVVFVTPFIYKNLEGEFKVTIYRLSDQFRVEAFEDFDTWEKALEKGLYEALKLI